MVQEGVDEELTSRLPADHIVDRVLEFYVDNCCVMSNEHSPSLNRFSESIGRSIYSKDTIVE